MGRSCLYEYTSCKHMSAITIRKYVCLEHSKKIEILSQLIQRLLLSIGSVSLSVSCAEEHHLLAA